MAIVEAVVNIFVILIINEKNVDNDVNHSI